MKNRLHHLWNAVCQPKYLYFYYLIALILPNLGLSYTEPLSWLARLTNVVLPLAVYTQVLTFCRKPGKMIWILFPLVFIAAFPLVARMVETSLREVNQGVIEAAQSMGASTWQIVTKVMLPEATPSLISGGTITLGTILGYGAMAGIIGGGGLGKMAINYGYYNFKFIVMWAAVIGLILLVQIFQSAGSKIATSCDKRLKNRN